MAKKAKKATNIRAYKTDTSLSSGYKHAKAPPKNPKPPPPPEVEETVDPQKEADLKHQQTLLNIFQHAFADTLSSDSLSSVLQELKQSLFNRDFETAFGKESNLEAYAARWSPTRALCYASVFAGLQDHLEEICAPVEGEASTNEDDSSGDVAVTKQLRIVSIGGGAAEIVAFAAFLEQEASISGTITNIDSAPWGEVIKKLHRSLTTPPPLSKYASAASKAANPPLILPSQLSSVFIEQDILAASKEQIAEYIGTDPLLVTLLFTLNELYTSGGIGKTTTFLLNLTMSIPENSLLLIVDSPGSYSETAVGKESKKYPTQWLLDRTLLKADGDVAGTCKWEKLETNDSIWFRLSETLEYPIPLENMRYQMHLYRAVRP